MEVWGFEYEGQTEVMVDGRKMVSTGRMDRRTPERLNFMPGKGWQKLRTDIDGLDEAIKNELENWAMGN